MAAPSSVLIVDDHLLFAESIRRLIEADEGVGEVSVTGTVAAALEEVRERRPDIVLMDYTLPDGDGLSAATAIIEEHSEVAVLMLAGSMGPDAVLEAIRAGCAGYIPKTAGPEMLRAAIRAARGGSVFFETRSFAAAIEQARQARSAAREGGADRLTEREVEILQLLAQALPTSDIASRLFLSPHTVRTHVQNLIEKLGAHSKLEAVAIAARRGLVRVG